MNIEVKARVVKVTGPRGTLERDFTHTAIELERLSKKALKVSIWFGGRKHVACMRTILTHINNMIKGVTAVRYFMHSMDLLISLNRASSTRCALPPTISP